MTSLVRSTIVRARTAAVVIAALFALSAVLAPSFAFGADAEAQIAELLDDAREDYDMLYFEEAVASIQEGVRLAEREGIQNRDVAELHIFLGLIRHADGDDDLAEDAFVDALETHPDVEVDSAYMTPSVEELFNSADRRAEPPEEPPSQPDDVPDDPTPDIEDAPPEEDVDPLSHDPIRRADAGEPVNIEADMPADLPVFRVHVHHRRYGESDFQRIEMDPTDATGFAAEIEGRDVRTSQLEYFITAIDRTGETIAESGRKTDPHRMSVIGDFDRDDFDDDPLEAPPEDPDPTGFYAMVAGGTDLGFLPGTTAPTANHERSVSPGLSPAFAHTLLNLGWRVTEDISLGMYFRWQVAPGQDFDHIRDELGHPDHIAQDAPFWEHRDECFGLGLPGDCMLGIRYQQVIAGDLPQLYSTAGLGIGRVRNWLTIKQAAEVDGEPNPACDDREMHLAADGSEYCQLRDTVRTGWAHVGVGGGMFLPIGETFDIPSLNGLDLVADSYLMILVPDTSVNLDINLGIRYRL